MMRGFDSNHKRMIGAVAIIEVMRMFGIFLVIPVFTLYGNEFTSSSLLIGIALGAYGLTMALFQAPFGIISDRFGRKNVIMLGMIPYIVGNLIAWHPFTIYGLIIGRLVAGAGAITSSGMAMVQESVPPERRNIAMALLGIPIGFAFMAGIILGPIISNYLGTDSLFLLSAILGALSLLPFSRIRYKRPTYTKEERKKAGKIETKAFFVGGVGFLISLYMMVFFFYLPVYGTKAFGVNGYEFLLLLPVIIGGIVAVAASGFADRNHSTLFSVLSLVIMLAAVPFMFLFPTSTGSKELFTIGTVIFFAGYSIYEIVFTPLLSKMSRKDSYGANIGIYNTMQFFGQFVGGIAGGVLVTLKLDQAAVFRTTVFLTILVIISLVLLYIPTKFREIKRQPATA